MTTADFFDDRWPVIYMDNHLLVLYKPAGLLVQGDATGDICLLDLGKRWLKIHCNKPGEVFLGLVHRLDRPVAGVVVFARTSKAAARLSAQFRSRTVEKQYLAVVEGRLAEDTGYLVHHIERTDQKSRVMDGPTPRSREARLHYAVLDKNADRSLIKVGLETGRRHQIRIQLAALGHPVVGDLRYGSRHPLSHQQIALLAHLLKVDHPTRHVQMTFTSPIPDGWPWQMPTMAHPLPPLPWDWKAFENCAARHASCGSIQRF
ncbi:RNA pseudouridine synthase [Desulfosarcina sp. OttesenSCG-928-B08]|nr:RNA pseudouridine synthase [Desulfosarcina sp. OttesenSCG-928-B08]